MWFEDIEIGARRALGSYTFHEAEMIAFAKKYDPQPIHIDPEAAKKSLYGGLIASGWHTASVWMKLAVASRMMEAGDAKLNRCRRVAGLRGHALAEARAPRHDALLFERSRGKGGFEVAAHARLGQEPQ